MHDNELVSIVMTAGQAKALRRAAIVVRADVEDVELELGHRRLDAALDAADGGPSIETLLQSQQDTLDNLYVTLETWQQEWRNSPVNGGVVQVAGSVDARITNVNQLGGR